MDRKLGFTLIELLVVVAILATLSTIAYPSYQHVVLSTRRADAQHELTKAQLVQSNHFITHPSYIALANEVGLPNEHDYYVFSVISASAEGYLMRAVVKLNSSQDNDKEECKSLYIDQNNNKTQDGYIDNTHCWY